MTISEAPKCSISGQIPERRPNLGRRTCRVEAVQKVIRNQFEDELASAKQRNKEECFKYEQRTASCEDSWLRSSRTLSPAFDAFRVQQNERDRLRVIERRQREAVDQRQTRLHAQQSRYYNRHAFLNKPVEDYRLS
ncbi:hypothetical protein NPIL_538361 [Nephila pilipes]|uniref:Uncharacterized protein n=1 Tax=Nephila pilipes TaxID=299642 RepID=A0A8X6P4V9_NEPPI|nr:hypothetical protein NPIL_538361 [Nephila pilipes]